jgi:hypothetical protein
MKAFETAKTTIEALPGGRVRATIQHETMKDCTPEMMVWWFQNLDTFSTFNGVDFAGPPVPIYRFWHPLDHVATRWIKKVPTSDGINGPGSVLRVHEVIGGKLEFNAKVYVTRFDQQQFNFELRLGGMLTVGYIEHHYARVEGGCSLDIVLKFGSSRPLLGALLNRGAGRQMMTENLLPMQIHNIEESGETEKFLPQLYAHHVGQGIPAIQPDEL